MTTAAGILRPSAAFSDQEFVNKQEVRELLERLAGQTAPFDGAPPGLTVLEDAESKLGYSQLNELLLLFGFDRITHAFFQFLLDGETEYQYGQAFGSVEQLKAGIDRFRRLAVLLYGNVKFAFKSLSTDSDLLRSVLQGARPRCDEEFASRHAPVLTISKIGPDDAYLTGYIVAADLAQRLSRNPGDVDAQNMEERRKSIVREARANQDAYLASDHLDVYVATSMREAHEFAAIGRLVAEIFEHPTLAPLNLRWFDPTQAYCNDRIDKGLSEALMLRRAKCTIYLAQETDTLGKDSELASTLAQGKPVVAYIPTISDEYVTEYVSSICGDRDWTTSQAVLLDHLRIFDPVAAWRDSHVRAWCDEPNAADPDALKAELSRRMSLHYDRRARTLRDSHPLGIQVNLTTGVANGVLVVRSVEACALLVRNIVTHRLEFDLSETNGHIELRERISGCIYRVVTKDEMLTNTFWNFYLDPAE